MARIVHVSDCFPPRVGGIETQVHDLACHQAAGGHEVHVLTATPGTDGARRATRVLPSGVRVHRMASAATFGLPFHPRGGTLVAEAVERLLPDVVHVHAGVVSPFAYDGARVAKRLGLPLAITWHCMLDGFVPLLRPAARVGGWHETPVALSAVSTAAARRVAQVMGVETDRVRVVPNGLDVAAWRPAQRNEWLTLPPDVPLQLVATQRLAARKRPRALVRLVAAAHDRLVADGHPGIRVQLHGGGPQLAAVRREVARRGATGVVEVLGSVPRRELPYRYGAAHAFLSSSRLEAFGVAALEARAAGLPVVAVAETGISQFITDGFDGLLADAAAGDDGLSGALMRLASERQLLARLRLRARQHAPPMSWDDVTKAATELYDEARRRQL